MTRTLRGAAVACVVGLWLASAASAQDNKVALPAEAPTQAQTPERSAAACEAPNCRDDAESTTVGDNAVVPGTQSAAAPKPAVAAPVAAVAPEPAPAPPARLHFKFAVDDERAPAPPPPSRLWYGWQTLFVDALSIGALALTPDVPAVGLVGFFGLWLGSSIVHFCHGNSNIGAISLGVRTLSLLAFVAGGLFALSSAFSEGSSRGDGNLGSAVALMGLAGMVTMIIVDAVLGFEKPSSRAYSGARAILLPLLDQRSRTAGLSVGLAL